MPTQPDIDLADRFSAQHFDAKSGLRLPYRWLRPLSASSPQPLVVFLHGAGERGEDNRAPLRNGAAELLASDPVRHAFPCYALVPQCPQGQRWVEVDWSAPAHTLPPQPSQPLAAVWELVSQLLSPAPHTDPGAPLIDASRVYLVGLSMGSFGVWDLLSRHPDAFAAAIAICGGGDEQQAARFAHVPVWAFHGALDPVVSVERSRHMIAALHAANAAPAARDKPAASDRPDQAAPTSRAARCRASRGRFPGGCRS